MKRGTTHFWEPAVRELCRAQDLRPWLEADSGKLRVCLVLILCGGAVYGASLGIWRAPLQAVFVAVKFPLLLSTLRPILGTSDKLLTAEKSSSLLIGLTQ